MDENIYPTPLTPPEPPSYEQQYSNQVPQAKTRGSSLTGLMVVQWINFGFACFGLLSIFSYLAYEISILITLSVFSTQIIMAVICLISAIGLVKYKKYGITCSWISVSYGFFSLITVTTISFLMTDKILDKAIEKSAQVDPASTEDIRRFTRVMVYGGTVLGVIFGITWIIVKFFLLKSQNAKEHARLYFQ